MPITVVAACGDHGRVRARGKARRYTRPAQATGKAGTASPTPGDLPADLHAKTSRTPTKPTKSHAVHAGAPSNGGGVGSEAWVIGGSTAPTLAQPAKKPTGVAANAHSPEPRRARAPITQAPLTHAPIPSSTDPTRVQPETGWSAAPSIGRPSSRTSSSPPATHRDASRQSPAIDLHAGSGSIRRRRPPGRCRPRWIARPITAAQAMATRKAAPSIAGVISKARRVLRGEPQVPACAIAPDWPRKQVVRLTVDAGAHIRPNATTASTRHGASTTSPRRRSRPRRPVRTVRRRRCCRRC